MHERESMEVIRGERRIVKYNGLIDKIFAMHGAKGWRDFLRNWGYDVEMDHRPEKGGFKPSGEIYITLRTEA